MLVIKIASNIFLASANICFPNSKKSGLFEERFFWEGGQFDPPFIFHKGNVKKSKKSVKIDNTEGESLHILCTISSYLLNLIKSR